MGARKVVGNVEQALRTERLRGQKGFSTKVAFE